MDLTGKKVLIVAHRGASAFAPENTMAAFKKAVELRADAIEFDVKLTKDGEMVIFHDQTLNRTTNGRGKIINCTYDELISLDAGSHFSDEFKGEKIPLLKNVLEEVVDHLLVNIEITNYKSLDDGLAFKITKLIKEMRIEDRVFFSSFAPKNLKIVSQQLPEVPAALLAFPGILGVVSRSKYFLNLSPRLIHPYFQDVNLRYVTKQHQLGRNVNVWTVNDRKSMKKLIDFGVDGLITDNPTLAQEVLEEV